MAAADGGDVVLVRPRPAAFAIFLRRPKPESPESSDGDRAVSGPA
jgi:hypothetical protein